MRKTEFEFLDYGKALDIHGGVTDFVFFNGSTVLLSQKEEFRRLLPEPSTRYQFEQQVDKTTWLFFYFQQAWYLTWIRRRYEGQLLGNQLTGRGYNQFRYIQIPNLKSSYESGLFPFASLLRESEAWQESNYWKSPQKPTVELTAAWDYGSQESQVNILLQPSDNLLLKLIDHIWGILKAGKSVMVIMNGKSDLSVEDRLLVCEALEILYYQHHQRFFSFSLDYVSARPFQLSFIHLVDSQSLLTDAQLIPMRKIEDETRVRPDSVYYDLQRVFGKVTDLKSWQSALNTWADLKAHEISGERSLYIAKNNLSDEDILSTILEDYKNQPAASRIRREFIVEILNDGWVKDENKFLLGLFRSNHYDLAQLALDYKIQKAAAYDEILNFYLERSLDNQVFEEMIVKAASKFKRIHLENIDNSHLQNVLFSASLEGNLIFQGEDKGSSTGQIITNIITFPQSELSQWLNLNLPNISQDQKIKLLSIAQNSNNLALCLKVSEILHKEAEIHSWVIKQDLSAIISKNEQKIFLERNRRIRQNPSDALPKNVYHTLRKWAVEQQSALELAHLLLKEFPKQDNSLGNLESELAVLLIDVPDGLDVPDSYLYLLGKTTNKSLSLHKISREMYSSQALEAIQTLLKRRLSNQYPIAEADFPQAVAVAISEKNASWLQYLLALWEHDDRLGTPKDISMLLYHLFPKISLQEVVDTYLTRYTDLGELVSVWKTDPRELLKVIIGKTDLNLESLYALMLNNRVSITVLYTLYTDERDLNNADIQWLVRTQASDAEFWYQSRNLLHRRLLRVFRTAKSMEFKTYHTIFTTIYRDTTLIPEAWGEIVEYFPSPSLSQISNNIDHWAFLVGLIWEHPKAWNSKWFNSYTYAALVFLKERNQLLNEIYQYYQKVDPPPYFVVELLRLYIYRARENSAHPNFVFRWLDIWADDYDRREDKEKIESFDAIKQVLSSEYALRKQLYHLTGQQETELDIEPVQEPVQTQYQGDNYSPLASLLNVDRGWTEFIWNVVVPVLIIFAFLALMVIGWVSDIPKQFAESFTNIQGS